MAMAGKIRNLNDLAKQVGCTATAVSMALHDSPQLSVELREKIKKTAKENDFVPRSYNRRTVRVKKRYSHLGLFFYCITIFSMNSILPAIIRCRMHFNC